MRELQGSRQHVGHERMLQSSLENTYSSVITHDGGTEILALTSSKYVFYYGGAV